MADADAATQLPSEAPAVPEVPVWALTERLPLARAWAAWSGFAELVPGEVTRAPPPFIPTHEMPHREWFAHTWSETRPVHALGVHFLREASIVGEGYVCHEGRLVTQDVYLHEVARNTLREQPGLLDLSAPHRTQRKVAGPVLEILGPGSPVYGHWLVDFLPRAAIAHETLGEAFHQFKIPLPHHVPDWTIRLLSKFTGFRPENALRYDAESEYLACETLASPTFGHGSGSYFFHSFVREFYARFARPGANPRERRICLSRKNFEHQTRGVLKGFTQRVYMEQAALQRGFEIICPEELSFDQQVELFSNVGVVVGEFGSGLHNTLFSKARTVVGSVRYPNAVQTRIAGLMGQDCVYLIPDEEHVDTRGAEIYSVSEDKIDRFLDQLVDLHDESLPGLASELVSRNDGGAQDLGQAGVGPTKSATRAAWRSVL